MWSWLDKIQLKFLHFRLQPIRVYCLHHVCEHYDPASMHKEDWMALNEFQLKVRAMQQGGVKFVSLTEAYRLLLLASSPFAFRLKRYAVLTFDDGYASLKEVLPWLKQQGVPATLFVNPDYADKKAFRKTPNEQYLTRKELTDLCVEIGLHGVQHISVFAMNNMAFEDFANKSIAETSSINGYIPFWAYTWGYYTTMTDKYLREKNIIPVYVDGMKNYDNFNCIHREFLN